MTTEVNGAEPQEETVDLFAKDFDDKQLMAEEGHEQPDLTPDNEKNDSQDPVAKDDEDLPEKYRGKSIHDVVKMHQELDRAYGRRGNELGELRQVTEDFMKHQLGGKPEAEQKKLDADTLLEDPDTVLRNTVDNSPKLKELEAKLVARERADALNAFNRKHPEAAKTVNDPRFAKWIEESPTRTRLLAQADQSYDYELMGELLSTFSSLTGETKDENAGEAKRKMKNAKPSGSGGGGSKKPVFTARQLAKLQIEDPKRYEALQDVIIEAYADGRVR